MYYFSSSFTNMNFANKWTYFRSISMICSIRSFGTYEVYLYLERTFFFLFVLQTRGYADLKARNIFSVLLFSPSRKKSFCFLRRFVSIFFSQFNSPCLPLCTDERNYRYSLIGGNGEKRTKDVSACSTLYRIIMYLERKIMDTTTT